MSCGANEHCAPLIPQIGVDTLSEILVFDRVADEAGIVLDCPIDNRGQIFNQAFREANAAKKREGQRAGFFKGSVVDDARPAMAARL